MNDDGRVVTVEIHGQRYPIRSALDAAYVAELAAYVDEKMRLAARESPAGDTLQIAVLAALNIADEYFRARAGRRPRGDRPRPARRASWSGCSIWRWPTSTHRRSPTRPPVRSRDRPPVAVLRSSRSSSSLLCA